MQTISLEKFRDALSVAAKSKGEPGVIAQKKLILDRYMIVDAEGVAIDPETLDVHLMPAAPQMEEDAAKPEEGDPMNQEEITKSVRSAVAAELKAAPRVAAVTAAPQAWETAKVYGKLKNFADKQRAWRFGTWCLGAMGHKKSADFCNANGLAPTAPADSSFPTSSRTSSSPSASSSASSAATRVSGRWPRTRSASRSVRRL